ncbi:MAG: ferrous iron transport protein A [candidate division Zixibacteria bacterium]|nr:ferrous iron transport protein A [candidate division Zixibacteria bacterium]
MTLLNANQGQTVSVVGLTAEGLARRRLLDLGFIPGTRVDVVRRSPLGDPVAYRVRGATIALRGADAEHVLVAA